MIINDYNILIRDYNKMNEKQLDAFNVVKNKQNLFLSGSAGTGKSFTIKKIVEYIIVNFLDKQKYIIYYKNYNIIISC